MLATARTLSLIEQKRLQWAREREEMVGLYGLWGKSNNTGNNIPFYNKSNRLPPIEGKSQCEDQIKTDESETSGYLSDSPKHLNEKILNQEHHYIRESSEELNNETSQQQQYWNEVNLTDQENFWTEKKVCKNLKNENWAQQNTDSQNRQRLYQANRNFWYGTPDSVSSDEGSRLRWGDRGVGIGHLWEPAIDHPDCRLPLVAESYRQTPKWVEKGLKNADGNKADILIIHHPDDAQCEPLQKNYLLGQNVLIPPEVIEERERKRKKALENQNAIKKQLEEREIKRRQEKENRIREERLEEERIKKEQEIQRLRYEDEQRKIKTKEENEKKKEEIMREAIELAEKRAREEKRLSKRHLVNTNYKNLAETEKKLERILEQPEKAISHRKPCIKTPGHRKLEETVVDVENQLRKEDRPVKDSSSQCEDIQLAQNFQFLNMNGMPLDGGLALMLDPPPKDNNFLLPPDGVQLALLMSPRTATATNRLMPTTPLVSSAASPEERILTPSKYRVAERLRFHFTNKSTQTDFKHTFTGVKTPWPVAKGKKQSRMCTAHSGSSGTSQKCSGERHYKHVRCFLSSKYRSKNHSSKSIEDRPKWGINRPLVQYKKQSEKDPYYQKKMKERLKKAETGVLCFENLENGEEVKEKEMNSVVRLLECQTDEDEKEVPTKEDPVLENGYRMNSNLSSPVFVPIGNRLSEWESTKKVGDRSNDSDQLESGRNENAVEEEENAAVPGSVGFLTQTQLEAIRLIANLREIETLQKQKVSRCHSEFFTNSLSTKMIKLDDFLSKKKEPAQVLDLSKVRITSKEDFKKYLDKIPECKVKPEKILPESVKIKEKDFFFVAGKKEEKQWKEYSYPDPTPPDMRGVKLQDLCPVNIDWKMLTTLRPKVKADEDMFSRLVQLGKLDLKYQQALRREKTTDWMRKTKNPKSSIVEMRILSCKECGEDFCDGSMCSKLMYDCFLRPQATTSAPTPSLLLGADIGEPKKKKKKRKGKRKVRKKNANKNRSRRKLGKKSIFNRPLSRGCNRDHSRWTTKTAEMPRTRALSSTRSFSTERHKTNFFERRSKSAPRIHFERNVLDSKPKRYVLTSDSAPSQSDYSSHSESESPDSNRKFFSPDLRLSGRRKLLSARVSFSKRSQPGSSASRRSHFVRRCTLYKDYHSDADMLNSEGYDSSSESSTRSPSKSPDKSAATCSKNPSTIQILFDEDYETPGLRFPEKIILPSRIAYTKSRRTEIHHLRNQELIKVAEGFSKIKLGFDQDSENSSVKPPGKEICGHVSKGLSTLSKFSGPYLKAKGLFEKKTK